MLKKRTMITLNETSKKIISLLLFEETFEAIYEEMQPISKNILADELKFLISKDYIKPVRNINNGYNSSILYDSDQLFDYSFKISAKGIEILNLTHNPH